MTTYTVALTDGTVGTVSASVEPVAGQTVTVELRDENGAQIRATGEVIVVIE